VVKAPSAVERRFDGVVPVVAIPRLVRPATSGLSETSIRVPVSIAWRFPVKLTAGRCARLVPLF